ncbi:MAG: stage III sporulation protein AF [Clostridium sp.]|nr:stage III sporulation protein AF [Clostridium sp.]
MEHFYTWVRTIIFYMIFMNFVTNLLPGKAYTRYIRLFMGMVLILLVIRPLTGSLRLDEQMARCFEEISFQNEAGEFQGQLEEIERQRFETVIDEYEKTVSAQAEELLEKKGYRNAEVRVSVNRERDSALFGTVEGAEVSVGQTEISAEYLEKTLDSGEMKEKLKQSEQSGQEQEIRQVSIEKNRIQVHLGDKEEPGIYGEEELEEWKKDTEENTGDPGIEAGIRKELTDFYGLEEHAVEIKFRK